MHHGSIKLYSEAGEGTTFTIRIPTKQDLPEIMNQKEDKQQ